MENLSSFDYRLPPELIAQQPLRRRDESRLMVVERKTGEISHRTILDLPELLNPGDCLVLNDTRVVPARLFGRRAATGGKWEGLFLGTTADGHWRLIGQTRGRLESGETIVVEPAHRPGSGEEFRLTLIGREDDEEGIWIARPETTGNPQELLERFGTVPLPPYIERKVGNQSDWQRYQTAYARNPGAVAAPTAGLHLTPELLDSLAEGGIAKAFVTLHVGIGTFRPVTAERLSHHRMHSEWCELTAETADVLNRTRAQGARIVAVGTTSVRVLETAAGCAESTDDEPAAKRMADAAAIRPKPPGWIKPFRGETDLFIRPPHTFRAVDALLTNFHLPRSTLLVLVSAFAGMKLTRRAYDCAIRRRYRFYSYGDAMLIV